MDGKEMKTLPPFQCKECGAWCESRDYSPNARGRAPKASGYESCLRQCEACGIGFSNTRETKKITRIFKDPFWDVPDTRLRKDWDRVLENVMNVGHREDKRNKSQSEKSEDHATWVVFRYLQLEGLLGKAVAGILELPDPPREPHMLLWGVPIPENDQKGIELHERLCGICNKLKENPRSEPDVILDYGSAGLIIIEVKLGSKNVQTDKRKEPDWSKYLTSTRAFSDLEAARKSGCYELARNWRIGWELAQDCPLILVNLGPRKLFQRESGTKIDEFKKCLCLNPARRFETLTWQDLLESSTDIPHWLASYSRRRGLLEK